MVTLVLVPCENLVYMKNMGFFPVGPKKPSCTFFMMQMMLYILWIAGALYFIFDMVTGMKSDDPMSYHFLPSTTIIVAAIIIMVRIIIIATRHGTTPIPTYRVTEGSEIT